MINSVVLYLGPSSHTLRVYLPSPTGKISRVTNIQCIDIIQQEEPFSYLVPLTFPVAVCIRRFEARSVMSFGWFGATERTCA